MRENRKVPVKKQKSDQKCPWKPKIVREKCEKSVRERGVAFREKSRKKAKNGFHGHFWFSRGKKTLTRGEDPTKYEKKQNIVGQNAEISLVQNDPPLIFKQTLF